MARPAPCDARHRSLLAREVLVRSCLRGTTGPSIVPRDRRPGRHLFPGRVLSAEQAVVHLLNAQKVNNHLFGRGQRVARTARAASTRWASAGSTSAYRRVLSPQSGLTHTSDGSMAFTASDSSSVTSSDDGTRGEWMS